MPTVRGNLYELASQPGSGENFTALLHCRNVVIERIVSSAAPEPLIYDQAQDEWVLLLQGQAVLEIAGDEMRLAPGDWLFIPAHTPHRVTATSADPCCIWLAVHVHDSPAGGPP